ncbi:primosomal protein N' [Nocardia mexicana]|nr:primosomal protein N' [Nocardia mexicana]
MLEPAHLDRDFDYLVPADMDALAQPGVRVRVRFSGRLIDGFVLDRLEKTDHTGKLMRLERVVSGERVLTPEILRLVTAVAARYAGTRADVLRLAIPPRHAKVEAEKPRAQKDSGDSGGSDDAEAARIGHSVPTAEPNPDEAAQISDADSISGMRVAGIHSGKIPATSTPEIPADGAANMAGVDEDSSQSVRDVPLSAPPEEMVAGGSTDVRESGIADGDSEPVAGASSTVPVDLSQYPAWERYRHGSSFLSALAHGKGPRAAWQAVPGEDWARRLAELAAVVVSSGRSAVLIVPDQRDLDRVAAACAELVGEAAVGLAAGLGPAARYRRWLAVLRGTARVVIGTRSAVFVPAQDLGLLAIWDDGDDMYGEPRSPYPHSREVAMLRAHETGAAFVAGGFSRTAEIQAVVESGWAHDLIADRAVVRQCAPRISAPGDSDVALERDPVARAVRIPAVAFTAARKALAAGESVLVQVPRRGYVPALSCAKCRTPARCRHCNGPLALPDGNAATAGAAHRNRGSQRAGAGSGQEATGDAVSRRRAGRDAQRAADTGQGGAPGANNGTYGGHGAGESRTPGRGDAGPVRSGSARELGVALSRSASGEVAHSPSCRWCGKTEPVFRCGSCGSRALRAVVIGAARTAEELGRAFPGVPIRGSGGASVLDEVPDEPQVVVATIGAEPAAPGGYGVALLLDGWALLGRADLRAAEDALRRWMSAATLVRSSGQVIVMAEPSLPTVQALVRWDPVTHAVFELDARTEVRFPPAVRFAAIDGTTDSIAELLGEAKLPGDVEVLGPVPLPPGARKPFSSGDSPAEVERMILRADRRSGGALSRALAAAQAVRSTHRSDAPLRVQIDPVDIG